MNKLFKPEEVYEKSPLAILISDQSERTIWCNARFYQEMQLTEQQVIGQLYPSLPLEAVDQKTQLIQLFTEKSNNQRFHYWQQNLNEPPGAKAHYFVKDRQASHKKLSAQMSKVMPGKPGWLDFLDYEVSRSRRYDSPLSILKVHILILSPSEAQALLELEEKIHQIIRQCLMDELRWADMFGHTDHGSYIIILPETPEKVLIKLQEKLHIAMVKEIEKLKTEMSFHIVFGRAYWKKHDDSRMLVKKARDELIEKLEVLLATVK